MKNIRLFILIILGLFCDISAMELKEENSDILYLANRMYVLNISPKYKHYAEAIKYDNSHFFENIDKNIQGEMRLEAADRLFLIHEDKVYYAINGFEAQYDCIPDVKCSVFFKKLLMLSAMAGATKTFEYLMTRFYMPFPSIDKPIPEYEFLNKWLGRCAGFGGDMKMFETLNCKGLINLKNIDNIWLGAASGNNIKILLWLFVHHDFSPAVAQEIFYRLVRYSRSINKGLAIDILDKMDIRHFRYETFGMTPLHLSIFYGNNVLTEILLNRRDKIEIDIPDNEGETPLFYAIRDWNTRLIRKLVDAGVNINAKNHMDATPLSIASLRGNTEAIYVLLSHGADPFITNEFGKGPIDMILEMLTKAQHPDLERYQEALQLFKDKKIPLPSYAKYLKLD